MEEKRKGYKTQKKQNEATKRYLDNNPDKRKKFRISNYKSTCKLFLKEYATNEDLEEIETLIEDRKIFLKKQKEDKNENN